MKSGLKNSGEICIGSEKKKMNYRATTAKRLEDKTFVHNSNELKERSSIVLEEHADTFSVVDSTNGLESYFISIDRSDVCTVYHLPRQRRSQFPVLLVSGTASDALPEAHY